jgi:peptide/nickel transport system ATP-binding protein
MVDRSGAVLEVHGLGVRAGSRMLTEGVSFTLYPGRTLALVGESGSGKSITASAVLGLLPPGTEVAAGSVVHVPTGAQWVTPEHPDGSPRGRGISTVFQDPMSSLNPSMRVGDQVAEPLRVHARMPYAAAWAEVERLFAEVELPDPARTARKYPHELSGGQKQRVMIALALASSPEILIADEPTTALDVTVQRAVLDLLDRLRRSRGLAVLFITHDLDVVRDIADDVAVMHRGRVVESGPVAEVLLRPQDAYTRELLHAHAAAFAPTAAPEAGSEPPLVAATGIGVDFVRSRDLLGRPRDVFTVLDGVNLCIQPGERVGLVGESGSGKSTLGRALLGLVPLARGRVEVDGVAVDAADRRAMRHVRATAQLVFQDPYSALNPKMRVGTALREVVQLHGGDPATVGRLLEEVGLTAADGDRYPDAFSGGQRQRLVIARALAVGPKFLVLDESVAALDVRIRVEILALLDRLGRERGIGYLFISHDLGTLASFCTRIAVLHAGRLVEDGPTEQVMDHPQSAVTEALLASRAGTRAL